MDTYDKNRVHDFPRRAEKLRDTLQLFRSRLAAGDLQGLKQMLGADVVLVSDGGGEINALAEPLYGSDKVLRLVTKLYDAYRDVTDTSLQVLNGEPAILIHRSNVKPGHASFFTLHCQLDDVSLIRRLHFVFAPSKLSALRRPN
jgi:hypothetical protein